MSSSTNKAFGSKPESDNTASKATAEADQKDSAIPHLGMLEEDDEFEEFETAGKTCFKVAGFRL